MAAPEPAKNTHRSTILNVAAAILRKVVVSAKKTPSLNIDRSNPSQVLYLPAVQTERSSWDDCAIRTAQKRRRRVANWRAATSVPPKRLWPVRAATMANLSQRKFASGEAIIRAQSTFCGRSPKARIRQPQCRPHGGPALLPGQMVKPLPSAVG